MHSIHVRQFTTNGYPSRLRRVSDSIPVWRWFYYLRFLLHLVWHTPAANYEYVGESLQGVSK